MALSQFAHSRLRRDLSRTGVVALVMLTSACAAPSTPPPVADTIASAPPAQVVTPVTPDHCGAADLRHLIGRSRREIPVPVFPSLQRVVCSTCVISAETVPRRLNFFFDAQTGQITEVRCG